MIKFLTAFTLEVDDPGTAAKEILEQLDPERSLLENSVGFVFCTLDFIRSGAAEAVCGALPFEVIGCTTNGIVVPGAAGEVILAVGVLTGEGCRFRTGVSGPLDDGEEGPIAELYRRLAGSLASSPSLIFVIHPELIKFAGDRTAEILDRLSGGVPIFGTVALDETTKDRLPLVVHNGKAYANSLSLLLVSGMEGRFFQEPIRPTVIYNQPACVTEAQGNKMVAVNNMPAAEFMEKVGILSGSDLNAAFAFPLLVDNHDGAGPKPAAIHKREGDGLRCGCTFSAGASLEFGDCIRKDLFQSTKRIAESIKKLKGRSGNLIFSCYGRVVILIDPMDEMELVKNEMETSPPYVFIYSAGEFCPVYDEGGGLRNRFHQFNIVSLNF
jgi:hypothetical protein